VSGPAQPLDLGGSLAELQAILDVVCGVPGSITQDERKPFYFPNVGANGAVLPDGSTSTNTLAKLEYKIVSITNVGQDELRSAYDGDLTIPGDTYVSPEGGALGGVVATSTGNREIVVQIKAETWDPSGGGAFAYVERVRTRLGLPTIGDRLEAAGVAIQDTRDARAADYVDDDGRNVCVAWFEVIFNAADSASDDPTTTIETVEPERVL
jgi:hypothetical protein